MSSPERTEQQRAAASALDRDVFLRAGAGTGKTTVLVDRYCAAARDPEVGVEGILAFTFTERAADQLRHRVREELADELETERAWISTIHGFCRRLLASHPAAAGIDPRFRVADEPEADRLAGRAFDAALERLVESGDAEAMELAAANRRRTLLEMTRGAYDELRSHGDPDPGLPSPPAPDAAAAIAAVVEAAREAQPECAEAGGAKGLISKERIAAAATLDPGADPGEELLERLGRLAIVSDGKHFQGDACDQYTRALKRARVAVGAQVLGPAYEQLRLLVKGYGEQYEQLKSERSALDYEDLQLRAVALLRGSEALRDRYREQFRHLMVDEFQDTNGLQLGLIEQLRGAETRLFLVGDEFQSIYGFRHADIEVYRREHRRFAAGDEPDGVALPLTGNFRAVPGLVATSNAIGSALLAGFESLTAAVPPEPAGDVPPAELLLTADDNNGWEAEETGLPQLEDDPSSASKVAEARLLAARLRELADGGEDPAEIVILLRAFTHVAAIERALAEAGLDPYVVGGRGFWSQQQIEDLRCLLAVLANPLDDEALFGALASPACAVLPDTLWLLRRAASEPGDDGRERLFHIWPLIRDLTEGREPRGNPEAAGLIPPEERQRLEQFANRLTRLRKLGTEGGLETVVDRVATAFDYDLATLRRDDGAARWANVRKLMRFGREFEAREGPDLAAFLEYLDSRAESRDRESEAATRAEGHAGVRVMTVHAAKGLEFGVVAVADLGRRLQLGWTPLRVTPGEEGPDAGEATRVGVQLGRLGRPSERLHDYEELTELAAEREAEEEGRLAYVAATRAKRRLILSGTFKPKAVESKPGRRDPISQQLIGALLDGNLEEREVEVPAAEAEGAPAGRLAVRVSSPAPGAGAELLVAREPEPAEPVPSGATPPLGRPSVPPALIGGLSYSALSDFESCGYRFYVERVLGIAEPEQPRAGSGAANGAPGGAGRFGFGVAVHDLLEWSARHAWREPDPARAAESLREQGIDDPDLAERAVDLIGGWLRSPLREELAGARVGAEVPFVLSVAGTLVRGSIDLLAEGEDGSVLVVDYKTDRLDGGDPRELAGRYENQRDLYALAAAGRGAPLRTAYVFLERPDLPALTTLESADLDEARARVERLLAELASGRFQPTNRPHAALCADCPARERLCSHGPDATLRPSPEPPIEPGADEVRGLEAATADGSGEPQLSLPDGG